MFGYERAELLDRPVDELLPGHLRQRHRAHRTRYRVEPRTRSMGSGLNLVGRRRDGTEFPVEVSLSPLEIEDALFIVAAVRDVSERAAADVQLRTVHGLLDATRDAMFIFGWDTLRFSYVNQGAMNQLGYTRTELLGMTMLHISPKFTESELRKFLMPLNEGRLASTMFTTLQRCRDGTDIPVEVLVQTEPSEESDGPRVFVNVVRDVSDRLIAEDRLRKAGENLRVFEERERIGRDLHDIVVQRLFAAGMSLEAASSLLTDRDVARRVDHVVDELDMIILDIRTAIYGLQRQDSDRKDLRFEVLRVVEEHRAGLGFEPRLQFDGPLVSIADHLGEQLLVTLGESLANVARHAAATAIEVSIEAGDRLTLRIVDDGIGIPDATVVGNGLGNLAARAEALDGIFTISSLEGGGTALEWSVPAR
ncbi:MAG: PAS domain S-box protein [Dehalococcoidia bacterium]